MHALFSSANSITHDVIASAIEVHKDKGPGLLESIYEWCMKMELESRGYTVRSQKNVIVKYKNHQKEYPLRFDLLINECLIIEVKAVESVQPIHVKDFEKQEHCLKWRRGFNGECISVTK